MRKGICLALFGAVAIFVLSASSCPPPNVKIDSKDSSPPGMEFRIKIDDAPPTDAPSEQVQTVLKHESVVILSCKALDPQGLKEASLIITTDPEKPCSYQEDLGTISYPLQNVPENQTSKAKVDSEGNVPTDLLLYMKLGPLGCGISEIEYDKIPITAECRVTNWSDSEAARTTSKKIRLRLPLHLHSSSSEQD